MDVWSWVCELLSPPHDRAEPNPSLVYQLASSGPTSKANPARSIQLQAERSSSGEEAWITFSVSVVGFDNYPDNNGARTTHPTNTIWTSDPCPVSSSDNPSLPLVVQLIQETLNRSPATYHDYTRQDSRQVKLKPDPVAWILRTHSPESFSEFFTLLLLTRLFWLCTCDAPTEVGSLYFHSLLAPHLDLLSRAGHAPVLKAFLLSAGADVELCLSRGVGLVLAKWLIIREVRVVGLPSLGLPLPRASLGISYASEACGLWMMKAYAPVLGMERCSSSGERRGYPFVDAKEAALRYVLAHQQVEAHIQLEYAVGFYDTHIQVTARVDNIRVHVVKLGLLNSGTADQEVAQFREELYFPSRIEFWVGPEIGSNYVAGLSLGRSTVNTEREVETEKLVKGSFVGNHKVKVPKVKTTSRSSTKTKMRNWRWDQDVEGNAAIFDAVLYDNANGIEVYSTKLQGGGGGGGGGGGSSSNNNNNKPSSSSSPPPCHVHGDDLGKRYSRVNRPIMKSGGLVFTGKEYGEEVKWRVSKEMEGSVLKWRIGGKLCLTYWPSDVESSFYETRCIELNDEVDLSLIPPNYN